MGHESAIRMLDRLVRQDAIPHALLLTGAAGIGKTTLALAIARALNCEGEDVPCGTCVHCRQIDGGTHPDVTVIESADGKDSIAIQQIRLLRDAASLRAFQGRMKVFVIPRAEELTAQAADALLKTLEDPQPGVTLILTALDEEGLPATVVSRCRVIHLLPVATQEIAAELGRRGTPVPDADRIARLARGSVGWALQAAKQPKLVAQQEELVNRLARVPEMSMQERLSLAETLAADRKDRSSVRRAVETMAMLARDMLLAGQDLPTVMVDEVGRDTLRDRARSMGAESVHAYLRGVRLAMQRIDANVDPRLALEALFAGIP